MTKNEEIKKDEQQEELQSTNDSSDQENDTKVLKESEDREESSKDLEKKLADAIAKAEENWQHFLSAKAEVENIQKRAKRDVDNAYKFSLEKFISELLAVKDSLDLGIKAAKESSNGDMSGFVEGNEMTLKLFSDLLTKNNVKEVSPDIGDAFDHEIHQAMTLQETTEQKNNTILSVIQKGYQLNGRLLRPALVIVAKEIESKE